MCLRDKDHLNSGTICQQCLEYINEEPTEPDLNKISPELRALFTQLTLQNRDLCKCWKTEYKSITIEGKKRKIENVYYGFYKADIGNFCLKRICGTIGCVNPAHLRSRFEQPAIKKTVRSGFNGKNTEISDLSDSNWLKQP